MSKQLRSLLKQNRVLEEKLFYESRGDDWRESIITQRELTAAISLLFNQIQENHQPTLCVLSMLNDIQQIRKRPLDAYEKNALQVVQLIFNYLREHSAFDAEHYRILNSLQIAFTRLSFNDLSFLDNAKHPAILFLNKLLQLDKYFHAEAGEVAKFFTQAIELLVDQIANREKVNNQTFIAANKTLGEYAKSFSDKISNNINAIFNDLEKQSRQAQADFYTKKLINDKTDGEEMPVILIDFLQNEISPILHKIISKHGAKSKQCQQLLTDLDTLSWSIIYPLVDDDYRNRFENDVAASMKRLYLLMEENHAFNQYVKDFFFEIESIQNRKLNGERVQLDVMISADIFADEEYESDSIDEWHYPVKKSTLDVNTLEEGAWYEVEHKNLDIRCQLLAIDELNKQLIFTNLSGNIVLQFDYTSTEEIDVTPLETTDPLQFNHALKATEKELITRLDILNKEYRAFVIQKEKLDQQKKRQKQLEIQAKKAIQRKIENEKRLEELKKKEQKKRLEQQRAEEVRLANLSAHQRFHVKNTYRNLQPGAQIAYKNDSGQWLKLTLSLFSETTGRYIFSDGSGKNILQPDKKELSELIDSLRLKVVKSAGASDPLQSLVIARRKKLNSL